MRKICKVQLCYAAPFSPLVALILPFSFGYQGLIGPGMYVTNVFHIDGPIKECLSLKTSEFMLHGDDSKIVLLVGSFPKLKDTLTNNWLVSNEHKQQSHMLFIGQFEIAGLTPSIVSLEVAFSET